MSTAHAATIYALTTRRLWKWVEADPLDATCMGAYEQGRESAPEPAGLIGAAYERLLELELAPQRYMERSKIPRIRLQFEKPSE